MLSVNPPSGFRIASWLLFALRLCYVSPLACCALKQQCVLVLSTGWWIALAKPNGASSFIYTRSTRFEEFRSNVGWGSFSFRDDKRPCRMAMADRHPRATVRLVVCTPSPKKAGVFTLPIYTMRSSFCDFAKRQKTMSSVGCGQESAVFSLCHTRIPEAMNGDDRRTRNKPFVERSYLLSHCSLLKSINSFHSSELQLQLQTPIHPSSSYGLKLT